MMERRSCKRSAGDRRFADRRRPSPAVQRTDRHSHGHLQPPYLVPSQQPNITTITIAIRWERGRPHLARLLSDLSSLSWDKLKQFVLQLGVPHHRIDDIEATHSPGAESSCRESALNSWLQMDVSASWKKVADALESCDVKVIRRLVFYCSGTDPPTVPTLAAKSK